MREICLELQAYRTREPQRALEARWLQVPAVRAAIEATIDQLMAEGLPQEEESTSGVASRRFFANRTDAKAALEAQWQREMAQSG